MKIRAIDILLLAGLILCANILRAAQSGPAAEDSEKITLGSGKTHLMDLPVNIERVSIAAPETAEAVPVSARSLMINGKASGETSLVIWLSDGSRREYDLVVNPNASRMQAARDQIQQEFGGKVQLTADNGSVFVTGRVRNMFEAQRATAIAFTLGKVVNLLKVDIPPQEQQILLKVRFADIDRSKTLAAGINFFGAPNGYPFSATTGQFSPTVASALPAGGGPASFALSDALNLFLFDPHLNIGATLQALASQNILQILAEPNLLAINGKEASFVAGGEFPYPTLQGGGGGVGQITIAFQQFGIQLHFLPVITPRGTIRLHVTPEVSSLDYANSLSFQGTTVPALDTRRVDTEVELHSGQSFAIAGLLDNQTTESLSKIPGLANIPVLGKLFTSKNTTKSNTELLVIVTPELVQPIPEGENPPELPGVDSFLQGPGILTKPPRTPGTDQTGPGTPRPVRNEISIQEMQQLQRVEQQDQSSGAQPQSGAAFPGSNPAEPLPPPGGVATAGAGPQQ